MHLTRELDFHGNGDDVEVVLVDLDLLFVIGHGECSLDGYVLLKRFVLELLFVFDISYFHICL